MKHKITKVFNSGNSQAVRIPSEFKINSKLVSISKKDDRLIIEPACLTGADVMKSMEKYKDIYFMEEGRNQPKMQERDIMFE